MLRIIQTQDNDIQIANMPSYIAYELMLDEVLLFRTEEFSKLQDLSRDTTSTASWPVSADRNSQELGEFFQLRIVRNDSELTFEVQATSQDEFEHKYQGELVELRNAVDQVESSLQQPPRRH